MASKLFPLLIPIFAAVVIDSGPPPSVAQWFAVSFGYRVDDFSCGQTQTVSAASRTQCSFECLQHGSCNSFSFESAVGTCNIHCKDSGYHLVNASGWSFYKLKGSAAEWQVVFKGSKHTNTSVYDMWVGSSYTIDPTKDMFEMTTSSSHYKSVLVEQWDTLNVKQVKFAFYTGGLEVMRVVFNGEGSSKTSWFAHGNILEDPYADLSSIYTPVIVCSIAGGAPSRRFFIQRTYAGCIGDNGWVNIIDAHTGGCSWDSATDSYPMFTYSQGNTSINWNSQFVNGIVGIADVMAIFVKVE